MSHFKIAGKFGKFLIRAVF